MCELLTVASVLLQRYHSYNHNLKKEKQSSPDHGLQYFPFKGVEMSTGVDI